MKSEVSFNKDVAIEEKIAQLRESEDKYRHIVENLGKEYLFYRHDTNGIFNYLSFSYRYAGIFRAGGICSLCRVSFR